MRADRLVSIVLLLQTHERLTAGRLARELEVSERTVRRDLDALAASGVPVYAERGRTGGWRLLPGWRTDLSGLRPDEVRALFLVAGPAGLAELGVEPAARSALRKLLSTLPEQTRRQAERALGSVVVDGAGWNGPERPPEHLGTVQRAVEGRRRLRIRYATPGTGTGERTVDPYGLVRKAGVWYLVAGWRAEARTFRVDRIERAEQLDEPAPVPADFDLERAWETTRRRMAERSRPDVEVRLRVDEAARPVLRGLLAGRSRPVVDGDPLTARFPGVPAAVGDLAGFGSAVEVLGPPEVRRGLAVVGAQLVQRYAADGG